MANLILLIKGRWEVQNWGKPAYMILARPLRLWHSVKIIWVNTSIFKVGKQWTLVKDICIMNEIEDFDRISDDDTLFFIT